MKKNNNPTRESMTKIVKFATNNPNGIFVYIAPSTLHCKINAWPELIKICKTIEEVEIDQARACVFFKNGSTIRLYGQEKTHLMKGLYFDLIVIDEAHKTYDQSKK